MKIKRNDTVKVIKGNDSGKTGAVLRVFPQANKVVVKGVHIVKKHVKSQKGTPSGGIIDKTLPVPIAKVMLVCPLCGKITRVAYRKNNQSKQRACTHCQKTFN